MQYKYRVITEDYLTREGTVEAMDVESAKRQLLNRRWQVIKLDEVPEVDRLLGLRFEGKVKAESISSFCNQLAMFIRSGVNLIHGLDILQSNLADRRLKEVIRSLHRSVSNGTSLAQAMRDVKGALPELLISLVAVGEESGNLDSVLVSMAAYYDRENFVRKKLASAAVYPIILTFVLIGLIALFMNFILPEISSMMADNHQSLPLMTQILLNATTFFTNNIISIVSGMLALVFGIGLAFKQPRIKYMRDSFLLRLPLLGKNMKNVITARFARTLALFMSAAIPLVTTLSSMEGVMGNEVARKALMAAKEAVIQGEPLHIAFNREQFFAPMVIQMMMVGEETGRLEEILLEVANHFDKLVEIGIGQLIALVEPIFTVIIGIFAGGLIISIALPIFNMTTSMGH